MSLNPTVDVTWDLAKWGADKVDHVETLDEIDFEDADELWHSLSTAQDQGLWVAHSESSHGGASFRRLKSQVGTHWGYQMEAEGVEAIRLGNTVYRVTREGSWRMGSVAGFVDFLLTHGDIDDVPRMVEWVFPTYSARITGVRHVGEVLGFPDLQDTFMTKDPREEPKVDDIQLGGRYAPKWAREMEDGERKPA